MSTFELIEAGKPVSQSDIESELENLAMWRKTYTERGLGFMVDKIDAMIMQLRTYKPKPRKPRKLSLIQADISMAQELIEGYRVARKYEVEADWRRKQDEYSKEFDAAILGKIYEPVLHHGEKQIKRFYEMDFGDQESLF